MHRSPLGMNSASIQRTACAPYGGKPEQKRENPTEFAAAGSQSTGRRSPPPRLGDVEDGADLEPPGRAGCQRQDLPGGAPC